VADTSLVDYYGILNLPPRADLVGIENAYARISDDLALRGAVDDTCEAALKRVNEAYSVLSKPELRRVYDREFFSKEIAEAERARRAEERRRTFASRLLVGGLGGIVLIQAGVLVYIGWAQAGGLFSALVP
jgi:curved DNA-binding protein CbpA